MFLFETFGHHTLPWPDEEINRDGYTPVYYIMYQNQHIVVVDLISVQTQDKVLSLRIEIGLYSSCFVYLVTPIHGTDTANLYIDLISSSVYIDHPIPIANPTVENKVNLFSLYFSP